MLLTKINQDSLATRKAYVSKNKDEATANLVKIDYDLYSSLMGDIKVIGVNEQREVTDKDASDVVSNYVKTTRGNIEIYTKAGDKNGLFKAQREYQILLTYMPQQITGDALVALIQKIIVDLNLKKEMSSMRFIMKEMTDKYKDQYNSNEASTIVKNQLG